MPSKKKKLTELPDEKIIGKLFHKKVRDTLKKVAHEKDKGNDEKG